MADVYVVYKLHPIPGSTWKDQMVGVYSTIEKAEEALRLYGPAAIEARTLD